MPLPTRRAALATLAALAACRGSTPRPPTKALAAAPTPAAAEPPPDDGFHGLELFDWSFPAEAGSERRCVVMVPRPLAPGEKLPVLVALHGLGEATDAATGAWGWPRRYQLEKTYLRLYDRPLGGDAFGGFVTPERLAEVNTGLGKRPFRGLVVACPYMPSFVGGALSFEAYAAWLGDKLLPRLRAELPVDGSAKATGIDGVSLGGWCALRVGLLRPDLFGAIGTLQPAVDGSMVDPATAWIAQRLGGRPLRIVTSEEDFFLKSNTLLDQRLTQKGVPHEFLVTPGPHDYPWNQGAGGVEMLLFHDRVLRG